MDAGTGECKHDLRSFRKEHGDSTRILLERSCQCSKRLCFQQFRGRESDVLAERFDFQKKEAYKKEPHIIFFQKDFVSLFFSTPKYSKVKVIHFVGCIVSSNTHKVQGTKQHRF